MTGADMYDVVLLALCCWREARNQRKVAQVGQAWTVRNRADKPSWWGDSISSVILKPEQYSSFNAGDPNSTKLPHSTDPSWLQCLEVAQDVYQGIEADPTNGATHYFDASLDSHPPSWATAPTMEHVIDLDQFRFYRLKGTT